MLMKNISSLLSFMVLNDLKRKAISENKFFPQRCRLIENNKTNFCHSRVLLAGGTPSGSSNNKNILIAENSDQHFF